MVKLTEKQKGIFQALLNDKNKIDQQISYHVELFLDANNVDVKDIENVSLSSDFTAITYTSKVVQEDIK